jgi:hypothetical protein
LAVSEVALAGLEPFFDLAEPLVAAAPAAAAGFSRGTAAFAGTCTGSGSGASGSDAAGANGEGTGVVSVFCRTVRLTTNPTASASPANRIGMRHRPRRGGATVSAPWSIEWAS